MAITILKIPVPQLGAEQTPFAAMAGGLQAGQALNAQYQQNQAQAMKNAALPASLKARQALLNAQLQGATLSNTFNQQASPLKLAALRAKLANGPDLSSPMGKAISDYQRIVATQGANSPNALALKAYMTKLNSINQGLNITGTPGGGFSISQGGLQIVPPSNVGTPTVPNTPNALNVPSTVGTGTSPGIIRSPSGPTSRYSTGGSTLMDPTTGNAISVPTQKTASQMQQTLLNESTLLPQIENIYQKVAPDIGFKNALSRTIAPIARSFGYTTPAYNNYESAIQTITPQNADQMLKTFGLNATNEQTQNLVNSLKPNLTDTPQSYATRIGDSVAGMMMRDQNYKNGLKRGLSLQGVSMPDDQLLTALQNHVKQHLLNSLALSPTNTAVVVDQQGNRYSLPSNQLQLALSKKGKNGKALYTQETQ